MGLSSIERDKDSNGSMQVEEKHSTDDCLIESELIKDGEEDKLQVKEMHEKLLFGIDSILKKGEEKILQKEEKRTVTHRVTGLREASKENFNVSENSDNTQNDENSADEHVFERQSNLDLVRVPNTFASYLETMAASHFRRPVSSILPSALQTGPVGVHWSLQDIRRDRFGMVRRIGHPYQNRTPPKRKKPRTSFTRLQIMELEKRFERQKYLASTERSSVAKSLKMTDAQVKTWFQNRRTKWRRQTAEEREMERQAANRLLLTLRPETTHNKAVMVADQMCFNSLPHWQEARQNDT